jgi:4'-phosphopantetheinyl transferase
MLERNVVQVWRVRLDAANDEARQVPWRRLLSPEELRRADGFHGEGQRRDYVTAHAALRVVLGRYLGRDPAAVKLAVRPPAVPGDIAAAPTKPALWGRRGAVDATEDLRFNLSHTAGAALIAVAMGREIGVDIERSRPLEDLDAMAHTIFSDKELGAWRGLPEADRLESFYRVWTRKEAYLKAIGLGLYRTLQDVTVPVTLAPMEGPGEAQWVRDAAGRGRWSVADVVVEKGCSGAVCWEGEGLERISTADLDLGDMA